MLTTGMILAERYEIIDKVGTGGMADVYKAKDQKLNRFVAVKVMKREYSEDTTFVTKFRDEAQAAAGFIHPNIVSVYDVGEEDGLYYIVMELVDGITLKRYIERKGKLTIRETTSIAVQVSMGIEAAHNNQIIHRDIKPQNIIISREGKAKVTDFGIAKATTADAAVDNTVMGSVHYTSPEQARGEGSDIKTDIYSLGITIYEMLTGKVPFDGDTTVSIALQHIQEGVPSPKLLVPEIPDSLDAIVLKCTQREPENRYQNMAELIEDLKRSLMTSAVAAPERRETDNSAETEEKTEGESVVEDNEQSDKEVNPKIDKVMSVLGIVAAVIIVGLAIFMGYSVWTTLKEAKSGGVSPTATETVEFDKETQRIMIDLTGMTVDEATEALNEMSLGIRQSGYDYSDDVEAGLIMGQSANAGEVVDIHTTIYVTISDGPTFFNILDVSGMSVEKATTALEQSGLVVKEGGYEYNDSVDVGCVISTIPAAGAEARKGDEVVLTISRGKNREEVTVPYLIGKSKESAIEALERNGLVLGSLTVSSSYDSSVDYGCVLSQSIESGKEVEEGTAIDLVLNEGGDTTIPTSKPEEEEDDSNIVSGGSGEVTIQLSQLPKDFDSAYVTLKLVEEIDGEEKVKVIYEKRLSSEDFPLTVDVKGTEGNHSGKVIMFMDSDQVDKEWSVTF